MAPAIGSYFGYLKAHDEQRVRLGLLVERYFPDYPNTCLLKLRSLTEALAELAASHVSLYTAVHGEAPPARKPGRGPTKTRTKETTA